MERNENTLANELQALDDFANSGGDDDDIIDLDQLESSSAAKQDTSQKSDKTKAADSSAAAGTEDGRKKDQTIPDDTKDELARLKAELLELKAKFAPADPESEDETLVPEVTEIDLFAETPYEKVVEDKDTFIKFINNLVTKVQQLTQESVYRNVPTLIKRVANSQVTARTEADKFYTNNKDLVPYKKDVAAAANLIANAKPGLARDEFYKEVADYVRYVKKLEVTNSDDKDTSDTNRGKPPLNDKTVGRATRMVSKPTLDGLEADIQKMLDAIESTN